MAGEWESDSLTELLTVFATDVDKLVPSALRWLRPIVRASQPGPARPSREQARRNVAEHYDVSSELFGEFLDETMTYSSALFDDAAGVVARTRRGAAAQDRPAAGRGRGRTRHPPPRDRHRMG